VLDFEDLDEQVEYLTHLTKSANPAMAEQAQEALDRIVKVGPHGYTHGWIHVGPALAGVPVHHPEHGRGIVTQVDRSANRTHVRFDNGREHSFERGPQRAVGATDDFVSRDESHPSAPKPSLNEFLANRAAFWGGQMGKMQGNDDLDEQVEYLTHLTKSANPAMAEQAQEALDRLARADVIKVGPKGYIHGWIHVGTPAAGARVLHPQHGRGTVTHHEGGRAHVRFDSGAKHSFEHKPDGSKDTFKPRGAGPMTDQEFVDRAKRVEAASALAKTHATEHTHMTNGAWNPDRVKMHKEIVDELYAKHAHVPNEGKAVIAGGLGGAGKSTVLAKHAGIDSSKFLTVNPDDIKEEMAKRGMVPDVPGYADLSPMERATFIHEESGDIAQMLADKAYQDKKNMIWDITMSSGSSVQKRVDALRKRGYGDVKGVFVHIPAETSVERAMARYRRGVDQFQAGKGHGGRYVPPHIIRKQKTSGGNTVNREVFDSLKPSFDDWSMYDNSGSAPVHVESKG